MQGLLRGFRLAVVNRLDCSEQAPSGTTGGRGGGGGVADGLPCLPRWAFSPYLPRLVAVALST
jgi:hypothetical protein